MSYGLQLDHLFLFAIMTSFEIRLSKSLQLDHLFLFAIIPRILSLKTIWLQLDHLFLFAIIAPKTPYNQSCCSLTIFSYLL